MNLKDRMKSDLPSSKPTETEALNKNEQNSSTNIMQKSKQPSREMELLEKQSEALKQVTEQRDKLLEEGRPEDQETIQKLSSQIQELTSLIQELTSLITELRTELSKTQKTNQSLSTNNRILVNQNDELRNKQGLLLRSEQEKLQDTLTITQDQAAKNKREYERKVEELKGECSRKVRAANDRADETEKRCARDNAAASKARHEAEDFRDEQQRLLREEQSEIDKLAEKKIADTKSSLKASKEHEVSVIKADCKSTIAKHRNYYKSEYAAKETWHILVFTFCILWLVLQALSSNYFRHEAVQMGIWIKDYVVDAGITLSEWTEGAANITSGISNEIASTILYWVVFVIVGLLLIALFYGVPLFAIFGGSILYLKSKSFDKANRWIMIGSGILFVAMASEMFYKPPINLLLLWMIVQVSIPLLRFIIIPLICAGISKVQNMDSDEKRNFYCNIMMVVVVIAGFIFIMWSMRSCAADMSRLSH